jgi:hypothetical protein
LVGRDGNESEVQDPETVRVPSPLSCKTSPAGQRDTNPAAQPETGPLHAFQGGANPGSAEGLKIADHGVSLSNYSDTASLVRIHLDRGGEIQARGKYVKVVLIGDKLYGLSDAPFKTETDTDITLVVPNDVLRANRTLRVQRLLWGNKYRDSAPLGADTSTSDFAVAKVTVLSKTADALVLGISGAALDGARVISPEDPKHEIAINANAGPAFLMVAIPTKMTAGLKQIVLQKFAAEKPASLPVVVPLSADATTPVPAEVPKVATPAPRGKRH